MMLSPTTDRPFSVEIWRDGIAISRQTVLIEKVRGDPVHMQNKTETKEDKTEPVLALSDGRQAIEGWTWKFLLISCFFRADLIKNRM